MSDIKSQLDRLSEFQSQQALLVADKKAKIEAVLTDDQRKQISDIEAEIGEMSEAVATNIATLGEDIREAVLADGQTVKGKYLQAVIATRRSWDNNGLGEYAKTHPEIGEFYKPTTYVSIKQVGAK